MRIYQCHRISQNKAKYCGKRTNQNPACIKRSAHREHNIKNKAIPQTTRNPKPLSRNNTLYHWISDGSKQRYLRLWRFQESIISPLHRPIYHRQGVPANYSMELKLHSKKPPKVKNADYCIFFSHKKIHLPDLFTYVLRSNFCLTSPCSFVFTNTMISADRKKVVIST